MSSDYYYYPNTVSLSAPRLRESVAFFPSSAAEVSPGESPSTFIVANLSLEHSSKVSSQDIFFTQEIEFPQTQCYPIGEEPHEDNFEFNKKRIEKWVSRSCSRPVVPFSFDQGLAPLNEGVVNLNKSPPPPGLPARRIWADMGSDSEFTPTPSTNSKLPVQLQAIQVTQELVLLASPPKKSVEKRLGRSTFAKEEVSDEKFVGKLKFYQLKKRFGFIEAERGETTDIFLCEDDLVLSGITQKQFKEHLQQKNEVFLEFNIKRYVEKGHAKKKAINITVL